MNRSLRAPFALLAALLVAAVLASGCSTDLGIDASAAPADRADPFGLSTTTVAGRAATTVAPPTTIALPDLPDTRGVEVEPVAGSTASTYEPVEIYGGHATLTGSLAFGGEPVVGATVQLERWVGGNSNAIQLTTGEGGGWLARDIHGGRYVVRAWKGDNLTLPQAGSVFVAEDGEGQIHLAMVSVIVPEADDDDGGDDGGDDESDDDKDDEDAGDSDDDEASGSDDDGKGHSSDSGSDSDSDDGDDTTTTTEDAG